MRRWPVLTVALTVFACGEPARPHLEAPPVPVPVLVRPSASEIRVEAPPASAIVADAPPPARPEQPSGEDAERVLFLATDLRTDGLRKVCPATLPVDARVRCLLSLRYEDEPAARALAFQLYDETGSLAGLLPEETTDDGRGGKVHLLPARPVGGNREHLTWIISAFRAFRRFTDGLAARAPVAFRDRPVDLRFFYSTNGRNPSAFAIHRNVGYNLAGVLNVSEEAVRDTLFHEIFHLNDDRHEGWSSRALAAIYAQVLARCGRSRACLSPYSPTDTMMDGVYYAFAPKGGVREYAAELGLRYFREHRLVLAGEPLPVRPFKCGPPENAVVWSLLAAEFFGGTDLVPGC